MVEYKEFRVGDLLNFESTKKSIHKRMITDFNGKYPYITRNTKAQGIDSYINYDIEYLNPGNTISLGLDTFVLYYQAKSYFTGNKVLIVSVKERELTSNIALYLITVLRKKLSKYTWSAGINRTQIKDLKISLPTKNNEPDWEYMEKYIEECKTEYVKQTKEKQDLEYKTAYQFLNGANPAADPGEPESYEEFRVGDILNKRTSLISGQKIKTSKIKTDIFNLPATSCSVSNHSLTYFVESTKHNPLKEMLVITANGDAGFITYHHLPFAIAQDSYALEIIDEKQRKENIYLYIQTVLGKITRQMFDYVIKANWDKRVKDLLISLPSKNNQPDWEYMDSYIEFIKNGQSNDPDKQSVLQQMKLQNETHVKELEKLIN